MTTSQTKNFALASVTLRDADLPPTDAVAQKEIDAALQDLQEDGYFVPCGSNGGPYHLVLFLEGDGDRTALRLKATDAQNVLHTDAFIPLLSFKRLSNEYAVVCDGYEAAVRNGVLARIEAADMGRRSLHNEGAAVLRDRLRDYVDIDSGTARRLFTLLHHVLQRSERQLGQV